MSSFSALAVVELQLIMHSLPIRERLKLARTCKFALTTADAPFAFAGDALELKLSEPLVPTPSLALRHAAVSIVWTPAADDQRVRLEDWVRRFPHIHAFDASASAVWIDSNRWWQLTRLAQFQHIRRIALPLRTMDALTQDVFELICALPRLESLHVGDVRARFGELPVLSGLLGMPTLTDFSCTPYLCMFTLEEFRQVTLCRGLRRLAISLSSLQASVTTMLESPSLLQLEGLHLNPSQALNSQDKHLMRMISAMHGLRQLSFSEPDKPSRLLAALTEHESAFPFPPLLESITLRPSLADAPAHAHFARSVAKLLSTPSSASLCFILLLERSASPFNYHHVAVQHVSRFREDPALEELCANGRFRIVWNLAEPQPDREVLATSEENAE